MEQESNKEKSCAWEGPQKGTPLSGIPFCGASFSQFEQPADAEFCKRSKSGISIASNRKTQATY